MIKFTRLLHLMLQHCQKYVSSFFRTSIFSLCVFLCVAFTSLGQNSNIQITSLATSGGSWSALTGGVYTFTPTADNANIISTDIQNRLNGTGFTKGSVNILTTNATGTQAGNVHISQGLSAYNFGSSEYNFTITATGEIRVSSAIDLKGESWDLEANKGYHVNLVAGGNILILAAITTSGRVNFSVKSDLSSAGSITLNAAGYVNTSSEGIITAIGGINSYSQNLTRGSGGDVSITGLAGVTLRSNISTVNGYNGTIGYGKNGNITINDGNAVLTSGAGSGVNDGQVSGVLTGGNFVKTGAGVFALNTNVNTYKGSTSITAGTLQLGASTNIPATRGLIIGASGVLDMAGYSQTVGSLTGVAGSLVTSSASGSLVLTTGDATNTSYEGSIENGSGTIGLVKNGSGTWRLSGSSSYTGTTILNAGIINVSHSSGLGMSSLVSVANGSELQLQNNVSIPALPLRLTGSGIMNNTGALRNISGDNSWAGTITLITFTATIISDAGTLSLMAVNSINSPSNISLTFSGIGNIHVLGSISTGTGALRKISEGTVTLSGVNTYTGLTSIIGGILKLGASHIINDLSALIIGGGTLHTNGFSENFGSLSITNNSRIILGSGSHQINFASLESFSATTILTITGWTGVVNPSADPHLTIFGKLEPTSIKFVSNFGAIKSVGIVTQFGKINFWNASGTGGNLYINSSLTMTQLNQIRMINSTDASSHLATQLQSMEIVSDYSR